MYMHTHINIYASILEQVLVLPAIAVYVAGMLARVFFLTVHRSMKYSDETSEHVRSTGLAVPEDRDTANSLQYLPKCHRAFPLPDGLSSTSGLCL